MNRNLIKISRNPPTLSYQHQSSETGPLTKTKTEYIPNNLDLVIES